MSSLRGVKFNYKKVHFSLDKYSEYATSEQLLNALQNPDNFKLVETLARVMEKEGQAYFDDINDIKDWLEDIIKGNNLKAIVFIWDEFTDYFRQNRAVSTLQELAHTSQRMPFYLFLITHRAVTQFNLDIEARKVLEDRFNMIRFDMAEVTAYQLMSNAISIKRHMKDEWETKLLVLWDEVSRCVRKLMEFTDGLKEEDLIKLIPVHPFSAYLLSIISQKFSSNQRTMFRFLKEETGQQETMYNFNWFINNYSIEDWHWLTADILWDYFFKTDNADLPEEILSLISYYNSNSDELSEDELKVFKCILLLIAMQRKLGGVKLLSPLESNLWIIFSGTPLREKLKNILDRLCESGILNSVNFGENDRQFVTPMMSYDRDKLNNIKKSAESQYSFEKCVEDQGAIAEKFKKAYALSGALGIRFSIKTLPIQNLQILKTRVNRFASELEPYQIGVVFIIVKSEEELLKVDEALREKRTENGRIILINVNQAFGTREWENWIDAKAREIYALDMNDGSNAKYYRENAEKVIDGWMEKVDVSTMIACFNGEEYRFSKISGLRDYLTKITRQVYPYGPETICENENLYKLSGYSKDAVLMGMNHKNCTRQYTYIMESLKADGFWQDNDAFILKPHHPVSMLKKKVDELMECNNSVCVLDIWNELIKPPYGLSPTLIGAFLFGYLLKEYAGGGYYKDDGISTVPLSYEGLAEVIESVMKGWRNHENYLIVKMKPEHEFFCAIMREAFGFTLEQSSCPRDTKLNIRRYLTDKKYPLWTLKYYLHIREVEDENGRYATEKLNEVIELLCNLISTQDENSELQLVEKVAELLRDNNIKRLLGQLVELENFKKGMRAYIKSNAPHLFVLSQKIGLPFNRIMDDIKNYMTEDSHWLWQENGLLDVLKLLEDDYRLIDALNNFLSQNLLKIEDAVSKTKEVFENFRLPWTVIKDYAGDARNAFDLLLRFVYSDSHSPIIRKQLALSLADNCEGVREIINNLVGIFDKYLQNSLNISLSQPEVIEIYNKLPRCAINNDLAQFNQAVKNQLENLKISQLMRRLVELWQQISGTSSPREWSEKNEVPILWLPNIDAGVFMDIFNIINSRRSYDASQIENAIAVIEKKRELFGILQDTEKINEVLINTVAGEYAYLVRDNINANTLRKVIEERFGRDIDSWSFKTSQISKHVKDYLTEQYKQKTYKEVLQKIDIMSLEDVKKYLKELIIKEPLVGIKILKSK